MKRAQVDLKLNKKALFCICVSGYIFAPNVLAAEWRIAKSLTVSEIYTDNVDLTHDQKKSDLITTLTPNISLSGKGARANVSMNASLQANSLGGGADALNPRLGANADAELLEGFVFMDASVNITQNTIDAFRPSGTDRLSNTNNTTNTYNYQISPYFTHRFKGLAEVIGRYTINYQLNSDDAASDSTSQDVSLSLNSGSDFTRLTWGGDISYQDSGSDNSNSELLSADLNFGYKFNRAWSVRSSAGVEWNDYETTRNENDGIRWTMSTIWTPNSRTSLNIGYGGRFFGSLPTLDFSHRSRRSLFTASYSRVLTDASRLLSQQSAFQTTDAFGEPIEPTNTDSLPLTNSTVNITEGLFVNEQLKLSYTLTGKRGSITVGGSHSIQKYENGRTDETLQEYNISMNRRLSSILAVNGGYSLSQQQRAGNSDALTNEYNLGLTHKIGVDSSLQIKYVLTDRESEDLTNDYQENRLQLSFTTRL